LNFNLFFKVLQMNKKKKTLFCKLDHGGGEGHYISFYDVVTRASEREVQREVVPRLRPRGPGDRH